jgi:hypothetical protein
MLPLGRGLSESLTKESGDVDVERRGRARRMPAKGVGKDDVRVAGARDGDRPSFAVEHPAVVEPCVGP